MIGIRRSIWMKTALAFFLVSLIVFSVVFLIFYRISEQTVKDEIAANASSGMQIISRGISAHLSRSEISMNALLGNDGCMSDDPEKLKEFYEASAELLSEFSRFIICEGDMAYYYTNRYLVKLDNTDFYHEIAKDNRRSIAGPYYSNAIAYRCIALVRSVLNPETGEQRIFIGEIAVNSLFDTYAPSAPSKETIVVLTSDGRTVYFQPGTNLFAKVPGERGLLEIEGTLRDQLVSAETGDSELLLNEDVIVQKVYLSNLGWYLYSLRSTAEFYKNMYTTRTRFISVAVLGIIMFIGIGIIVSMSILRPIKRIADTMDKVQEEILEYPKDAVRKDEIGRLWRSFYRMIDRLRETHDAHIKTEREKSYLEYRILQNQIKPHFLFNVHLCIQSLLDCGKIYEAQKMLQNMDTLLRISMDEREMIPLSEEIDVLKKYVELQRSRTGGSFVFCLENDVTNEEIMIPKLLIQPVVENSIKHGISDMDGEGEIDVFLNDDGHELTITVEDNGHGISEEVLEKINNGDDVSKNGMVSIGVRNIKDRIRLCYGNEYGMMVSSIEGVGTRVVIRIPSVQDEKAEAHDMKADPDE